MSTQKKLVTFLRLYLSVSGFTHHKKNIVEMTLQELLTAIGLSNELLVKQTDQETDFIITTLNRLYDGQIEVNLIQKKLNMYRNLNNPPDKSIIQTINRLEDQIKSKSNDLDLYTQEFNIHLANIKERILEDSLKLATQNSKEKQEIIDRQTQLKNAREKMTHKLQQIKNTIQASKKQHNPSHGNDSSLIDSDPEATSRTNADLTDSETEDESPNQYKQDIKEKEDETPAIPGAGPSSETEDVSSLINVDTDEETEDESPNQYKQDIKEKEDDSNPLDHQEEEKEDDIIDNLFKDLEIEDNYQSFLNKEEKKDQKIGIGFARCPYTDNFFEPREELYDNYNGKNKCAGPAILGSECSKSTETFKNYAWSSKGSTGKFCSHVACTFHLIELGKHFYNDSKEEFRKKCWNISLSGNTVGAPHKDTWDARFNNKYDELRLKLKH